MNINRPDSITVQYKHRKQVKNLRGLQEGEKTALKLRLSNKHPDICIEIERNFLDIK